MSECSSYMLIKLENLDINALNALTEWFNHAGRIEFLNLIEKRIESLHSGIIAMEEEEMINYFEYGIATQSSPSYATKASLYALLKVKDIFCQLDKQLKEYNKGEDGKREQK
jgi:hypothetical protein